MRLTKFAICLFNDIINSCDSVINNIIGRHNRTPKYRSVGL